jgi:CheY-like chemotaxis protein
VNDSCRILLVEDDAAIREGVAECLAAEGYEVGQAAHVKEALEWLRREGLPHLVVVDLVMPVMNGAELISRMRADPSLKAVRVVLMTAAIPSPRGQIPQADGMLTKPFELDDLLAMVAHHCRLAA